jgi:hypothetical protein
MTIFAYPAWATALPLAGVALAAWRRQRTRRSLLWLLAALVYVLPETLTAAWIGGYWAAHVYEKIAARSARVENLKDAPIAWDAAGTPMGLAVEFDVVSPYVSLRFLGSPVVWLGPAQTVVPQPGMGPFYEGYLKTAGAPLRVLQPVLYVEPMGSATAPSPGKRLHAVLELYPGKVEEFKRDHSQICLKTPWRGDFEGARTSDGASLSAYLGAEAAAGEVDLSAAFTAALRARGALQGKPELWRTIQENADAPALLARGYHACGGRNGNVVGCFCK